MIQQNPLDELRTAIYRYLVNSAFLNLYVNEKTKKLYHANSH